MSDIEQDLRSTLTRRAARVDLQSDLGDLEARIDRSERRRDAIHNAVMLTGAAACVLIAVVIATVVTGSEPKLINATAPVTTTTVVPGGVVEAKHEVVAAFSTVFEPGAPDATRVTRVDDNHGLAAFIARIRKTAPTGALQTLRLHVDKVSFPLPHLADVAFTVTSTDKVNFPGERHFAGGAVYQGGVWKLTRATFCHTVEAAGPNAWTCPA